MIPALATFRPAARAARLPVTLVTGFLGSGKTTLVNHILANCAGVRTAVLVNELGEIGIDNELIVAAGEDTIELSNGCICCSTNNDLVEGIVRVLARPEPIDHIVVETTGVADPLPVARTFMRPEFAGLLRLDAIVALADAEHFSLDSPGGLAALSQLRHADVILVNKCDLVDVKRLAAVEDRIRAVNADARLLRTTQSAVPLGLILDVGLFDAEGAVCAADHLAEDGFTSLSFESDRPFSVARFQAFLDTRPPGLFRGKGFLWLAETGRRYVFHLIGQRFTLEDDRRSGASTNRLVLIGQHLDIESLRTRLAQCLAGADGAAIVRPHEYAPAKPHRRHRGSDRRQIQ